MDEQDIALSRGQTMRGNSECAVSGPSLTCECSLLDTGEYCSSEEVGLGSSFDWADQVETAKGVAGGHADLCGCFILFQYCFNWSKVKGKQRKETVRLWLKPL